MRRLLAGISGLLLVVTVGCGSSGSKSSSSSTSSSSSATTTTTTTTSTTTTTTTTTAPPSTTTAPVNGGSTPEITAQGLYDRWVADDRAGAAAFANPDVLTELFAKSGAGANWMFQGCSGTAGGAGCQFSYEGGAVTMILVNQANIGDGSLTGYRVSSISFTAD
jgi:hypothetical protein